MPLRDQEMWKQVHRAADRGVPWYLMASYAYYEEDSPLLSDAAFDDLSKYLAERWATISHRHKDFLSEEILAAGTRPKGYPEIAKDAALRLIREGDLN